jgi:hypothetical protein
VIFFHCHLRIIANIREKIEHFVQEGASAVVDGVEEKASGVSVERDSGMGDGVQVSKPTLVDMWVGQCLAEGIG